MKNVVFLVESYFRNPNANGICVKNIADCLVHHGHNVHILTTYSGANQPYKEVVKNVKVKRLNRSLSDFFYYRTGNKLFYFVSRINRVAHNYAWPLASYILILKYYRSLIALCKREKVDTIIGTYLHIEEVVAALMVKKKYPKITCIIYTLDAMGGRIPKERPNMYRMRKKAILRWERKALTECDYFCAMNSHRDYLKKQYGDMSGKIVYMDIPLITPTEEPRHSAEMPEELKQSGNLKKFVFTGTITQEINNPAILIDILPDLDSIALHIFGTVDPVTETIIRTSPLYNKRLFFHGKKTYDEIVHVQNCANALVTFGNANRNMIPGKIFEYIQRQKPIISYFYSDDDSAKPYLKRYKKSCQIDCRMPRHEIISRTVAFLSDISEHQETDADNNTLDLQTDFYSNTPSEFAEFIIEH